MYQGTLEPVSNRADWFETFELVNDDTGVVLTDLDNIVFKLQVRSSPSVGNQGNRRYNSYYDYNLGCDTGQVVLSAVSGDAHTSVTNGVILFHFTASEMSRLPQGSYVVGLTATYIDGSVDQEIIATLPVLDGIVR